MGLGLGSKARVTFSLSASDTPSTFCTALAISFWRSSSVSVLGGGASETMPASAAADSAVKSPPAWLGSGRGLEGVGLGAWGLGFGVG